MRSGLKAEESLQKYRGILHPSAGALVGKTPTEYVRGVLASPADLSGAAEETPVARRSYRSTG